jgi:ribosomal protein S27AE
MELSLTDLQTYFKGDYFHTGYSVAVAKATAIRVHADGIYPKELIEERRPHESATVHAYRQKIWKPITKPDFAKVLNSLAKIRRSTEWSVRFENEPPKTIIAGEDLATYLTANFPNHTSLTNWAFSVLLRDYAVDANAWVVVITEETQVVENTYLTPRPVIYRSDQIVDFGSDFLVVKSDDVATYYVKGSANTGAIYYVITDTVFQKYEQKSNDEFGLTWEYIHNLGRLPAFQMKGVVLRMTDQVRLNESRLAPMLPRLDEAVREYSDLQAEVVQHIHSEKWEIGNKECAKCTGAGFIENIDNGARYPCESCHGTGWEPRGPYTVMMVEKAMAGDTPAPTPPMGYVTKDVTIVNTQDRRVENHIFHALSAVNMQFLLNVPLAESGIAKAYDADETNNFVHSVAEDIVAMLDTVCLLVVDLRYGLIVPQKVDRVAMLPTINVPDRFDLFSAAMIEEELTNAKERGVNSVILNALELDYISKKFSNDAGIRALLTTIFKLDPLPNVTEENKALMLMNGGITKQLYVLTCNIYGFVTRAVEENPNFFKLKYIEQKKIVEAYATEQVNANTAKAEILSPVAGG